MIIGKLVYVYYLMYVVIFLPHDAVLSVCAVDLVICSHLLILCVYVYIHDPCV